MIVDTLIHARWIIPVEPESVTYEHHTLVINKGKIIDLLPTPEAKRKYTGTNTEQLDNLPHPRSNDVISRYRR